MKVHTIFNGNKGAYFGFSKACQSTHADRKAKLDHDCLSEVGPTRSHP